MTPRDIGFDAWRELANPDIPASGPHEPDKSDIRAYVAAAADESDALAARVSTVETVASGAHKGYQTWAELSGVTPAGGAGSIAEVMPTDAGTHTDPVVGGTVANSGVFIYSASPAGWEWVYAYPSRSPAGIIPLALIDYEDVAGNLRPRFKIALPNMVYPAGMVGVLQAWPRMGADKPFGSVSYDLYEYYPGTGTPPGGTVQILNDASVVGMDGTAYSAAGAWLESDAPMLRREADGLTYFVRQPSPGVAALQASIETLMFEAPSLDEPVFIHRATDRTTVVKHKSAAYDDADLAMDQDHATTIFYDMARAQSYGAQEVDSLYVVNSNTAEIHGQVRRYGQYLSNEGNGGNFDRESHTTTESVIRAGLLADPVSGYGLMGAAHGGLANAAGDATSILFSNVTFNSGGTTAIAVGQQVTGAVTGAVGTVYKLDLTIAAGMSWANGNQTGTLHLKGRNRAFQIGEALLVSDVDRATATSTGIEAGDFLDMEIGSNLNCAELRLRNQLGLYWDHADNDSWCGETVYTHVVNVDGVTYEIDFYAGRRLEIEAGEQEPAAGDVVTGATSGAVGTVVIVPTRNSTGDWGDGDWAGTLFLENITGAFEVGEDLEVGGDKIGEVAAVLSPEIGWGNSYGPLMKLTTVNRIKLPAYHALEIGQADGVQHPNASDNDDRFTYDGSYATYPAADLDPADYSPIQCWHAADATSGRIPIFEMHFDEPCTPPGDFSLCDTSQISIEDRAGGNRSVLVNIISGTTPELFEGHKRVVYRHQWRLGDPIDVGAP